MRIRLDPVGAVDCAASRTSTMGSRQTRGHWWPSSRGPFVRAYCTGQARMPCDSRLFLRCFRWGGVGWRVTTRHSRVDFRRVGRWSTRAFSCVARRGGTASAQKSRSRRCSSSTRTQWTSRQPRSGTRPCRDTPQHAILRPLSAFSHCKAGATTKNGAAARGCAAAVRTCCRQRPST